MLSIIIVISAFLLFNCGFATAPYSIALVKQVTYQDLYCCRSDESAAALIFSTFKRTGPVALFTKYGADFFIVHVEPDSECMIWKEKPLFCHQEKLSYYESLAHKIPKWGKIAGHTLPQGAFSVHCSDINWSQYDIVISLDIAVPTRIVKAHPKVLWCYFIGEGVQPSYSASLEKPLAGYDCFLTQDYHVSKNLKQHVVDFPYMLQYYGCFHELLCIDTSVTNQAGIFCNGSLDKNQLCLLQNIGSVYRQPGPISAFDRISTLVQTKYFTYCYDQRPGQRTSFRGNALVEAVATGNLVVANDMFFSNTGLLSDKTTVRTFQELLDALVYFESNPEEYKKEVELQRTRLQELCCDRPMQELFEKYKKKIASQKR